ncbi:hypothetical protein REPUB_Repub15cG0105500 [Reevesia pubescens]
MEAWLKPSVRKARLKSPIPIGPVLPRLILERTEICISISSEAESHFWRAEVLIDQSACKFCSEAFLPKWRAGSVSILAGGSEDCQISYVQCIISEQIFTSKSDLLEYEEAIEVAQLMDQSLDENNFELTAPLDMETDHFYLARMSLIESHLQKIHDGLAVEILITSRELHMGTACRGVNWDR